MSLFGVAPNEIEDGHEILAAEILQGRPQPCDQVHREMGTTRNVLREIGLLMEWHSSSWAQALGSGGRNRT